MSNNKGSMVKRIIAAAMMFVMAFMLPAGPLRKCNVQAAEVRSSGEYIKEVKLFIKKGGSAADANAWCEEQGDGWKVLSGDEEVNLNSGASGAFSKEVGVFLCYKTTTDPDEAITDLAVMNEKGNYSANEYEMLLKKQKESYIDMVKNMRTMIGEYQKNYEKKTPMAVKSHDFLNTYKDDDMGELLGDILLTADDDRLAEILLQCNGMVVLTVQEKLAAACDTAKTTWLDRMVKLGSYDKLKAAFSKNMPSSGIEKAMEKQYRDKARTILAVWDGLSNRISKMKYFVEENGLTNITEEKFKEWESNLKLTDKAFMSYQEFQILLGLAGYKYGDKTLLDFFAKPWSQVEKEGLEILYPMAACLTDGQISALSESVGLYQMVMDAMGATIVNNNNAGAMAEIKSVGDKYTESMEEAQKQISEVDKMVESLTEDKISIYEGVDRDVYKGGVAVTTDAKNYSSGTESSWTELFVKNGNITALDIAAGVGVLAGAALAVTFAKISTIVKDRYIYYAPADNKVTRKFIDNYCNDEFGSFSYAKLENMATTEGELQAQAKAALADMDNKMKIGEDIANAKSAFYSKLKWGFTVFTILLSAADIALTVYSLYQYYNVDHLQIPHHMVDMKYSETEEASYVAYKSVTDQDGNYGDLNGNSARQWLALYYTKDKKAGAPLLAPTENGHEMVIKVGSTEVPGTGYAPLHMFGTPKTAQNLTFADGDSGYCYNDKKGGTYLYFSHANAVITYTGMDTEKDSTSIETEADKVEDTTDVVTGQAAEASQTGTVVNGGYIVLAAAAGVVLGGLGGFVIARRRRKI